MSDGLAPLQLLLLAMTAVVGTALVLTRETRRQALVAGFYGLVLSLLFFVLQAPDVALSEIAVGAVAVPLMLFVALASTRRSAAAFERRAAEDGGERPDADGEASR